MTVKIITEVKKNSFWLAVLAECLGSVLLVLFGCGLCGSDSSSLSISLGFGLLVGCLVWSIGHISGGHVNPAVTLSFLITRKINPLKACCYIISQCFGATLGALILQVTHINDGFKSNMCTVMPVEGLTEFSGFIVEALITFLFVFVVFATCDSMKKGFDGSGPLAVAASIVVGHLWAVTLTGAGTNPARAFGPAVVTGIFKSHWIYWLGPLIGGLLAGLTYDLIFSVNACKEKAKALFMSRNYDDNDFSSDGANIINLKKETADIKTASV